MTPQATKHFQFALMVVSSWAAMVESRPVEGGNPRLLPLALRNRKEHRNNPTWRAAFGEEQGTKIWELLNWGAATEKHIYLATVHHLGATPFPHVQARRKAHGEKETQ
jgi:hypothetical protein